MHDMRRSAIRVALLAALAAAPLAGARAGDYTLGPLKIIAPWSRATPGGSTIGAGYLTIENTGSTPDRLVSATTPAAAKAEIHRMTTENGVMRMRPVKGGIPIPPGKTVTLAPNGLHLMFMGLKAPLKQGGTLTATLQFEKAGTVTVAFAVQGIGASAPPGGHMQDMHKM